MQPSSRQRSPERQLPLAPSPLQLPTTSTPGRLLPKIKAGLTAEQVKTIAELEREYLRKKTRVENAPPAPVPTQPGRLRSQRPIDGPTLLSLKLAELQAGLDLTQEIGRTLRKQWREGLLDITQADYNKALEDNEKQTKFYLSNVCTIRSHRHGILGTIADDTRMLRIEVRNDWAYIDGILRALRNPYNATKTIESTRPGNTQARFRKALVDKYEASQSAKKPMESLWCPIVGAYCDGLMMRAAHIVKKNVGENTAQALFGETQNPQGHIWQPSNGLLIYRRYKMWLDAGAIVIVPDDDAENEFKVVVLDMSAFDNAIDYSIPVGAALDGRRLQFRGTFRPQKRYLYFKMAVTLLHRQRAEVSGSAFDRSKLPDKAKDLWLTPGSYLTGSVLFKLARKIGNLTADKAAEFWGISRGTTFHGADSEADELSETLSMGLLLALNTDGEGGVEAPLQDKAKAISRRKQASKLAITEDDDDEADDDVANEDEEDNAVYE